MMSCIESANGELIADEAMNLLPRTACPGPMDMGIRVARAIG